MPGEKCWIGPHAPTDVVRILCRVVWGYCYHGKEAINFDPEVHGWDAEPEHVDYEPLLDDQEPMQDSHDEQDPDSPKRPSATLQDALRAIPRAWLAKHWGKSESEIKRIRNKHVHLSRELRDEAARLMRLYHYQQEIKAESDYKAEALMEQERDGRQRAKETLAAIRAMGRIKQPARTSTESDLAYARVLSDYRRRVPRSLRNAQGGGLPLDVMCSVLTEQGVYHGDADDLDAFGEWLHDLVAKNRKGLKTA